MNQKTFTVVYVFGPKRCEEKYQNNAILDRTVGEWVKIGETSIDTPMSGITRDEILKAALSRCGQESRTGIPELSCVYDVFIFPFRLKTDMQIRKLLCNDIYSLENTSEANRNLNLGEIAPGTEFVYGVCRNHIKHAVESFDHDLIVNATDEELPMVRELCIINAISIEDADAEEDTATPGSDKPRCPKLNLDKLLNIGDVVELSDNGHGLVRDESGNVITAEYNGNNSFIHDGETGKSSTLALRYVNRYGFDKNGNQRHAVSINGNNCWMLNGKVLKDYFDEHGAVLE